MNKIFSSAIIILMIGVLFTQFVSNIGWMNETEDNMIFEGNDSILKPVRAVEDAANDVSFERGISGDNKYTRGSRDSDIIKVMFDDAHLPAFSVDPANEADDVHGWGQVGEGGHSSFADVLRDPKGMEASHPGHTFETENTYEVVLLNEGELFTKEALEDIDVLVVPMTFNGNYRNSEIDVIEDFVKNGGGLLLIGDHSNFPAQVNDIAMRFFVRWGSDVVTDVNDYTGPYNYWLIYEDNNVPGDDNMPTNDIPGYENDPDQIYIITENAPTVQYYCSNAYTLENPTESRKIIVTDTDGSSNFNGEPACLAIPNGNCTGAGRAVFVPDCNVFGDTYDCDEDGKVDFWDEHNAEFGLGIIDWLAPRAYEVALISGEKDPYTGLPKPLVYIYEPGETHTFDIEVWNLGLRADTIKLEIPNVPGNWTASLDIEETSELDTRESEHVTLTVTAPLTNVTDGDYAIINVTATSTGDPENATDTIWTTNVIIVDLGYNVNWAVKTDVNEQKKIIVDPGKTTVATLGVNNIGNINDTYKIDLQGVPSDWEVNVDTEHNPGWVFDGTSVSIKNIELSSYHFEENTTGVTVFITPPIDAKEGETAIITAVGESALSKLSGQDAKGKHDDELIFEVSAFRAVEIECDEAIKYVDPGKSVTFLITVKNNGNSRESIEIQLGPMISGWTGITDMPTIILQARQRKTVSVTITAPEGALEGSRCVLEVKVNMPSVDKVVDSVFLTTIVNRFCIISASLEDIDYYNLNPGDKISLNLSVSNLGNGMTGANFFMSQLAMGWDFEFFFEGLPVDYITLEPFQTLYLRLDITVSLNALADAIPETAGFDPYTVMINISGEENFEFLFLSIQVSRKSSIDIFTSDDMEITEPGAFTMFRVCVRNDGNAWDEVQLNIEDIPLDLYPVTELRKPWTVFFSGVSLDEQMAGIKTVEYVDFTRTVDVTDLDRTTAYEPSNIREDLLVMNEITLRIPRKGAAWVTITAEVPRYASARDASFNITSICIGSPGLELPEIRSTVSVRNADLTFVGGIELPETIESGQLVSVMVHVKNTGDIRAEDVQVRLYVDGLAVATMPIRTILAGNTQMVAFTWKVPDISECKLKVIVDPDNLIVEKDKQDNTIDKPVLIEGSSGVMSGIANWVMAVVGIIVLGFVLTLAFLWAVRK
ncbi:MAG: CARDB domain-containing protein [Candidatus Thermoplasmatota archaeon]|nr:CARDB domain-containing protein [Candidatus Thermoplasmatota archaeon]